MRILVVTGFWPTPSNSITGIFVVQQVQAYIEAGCAVTVIAPQVNRPRARRRPYSQTFSSSPLYSPTYLDIPQRLSLGEAAVKFNVASYSRAVTSTLHREGIAEEFDGIHIHEPRYAGLSYVRWRQKAIGPALVTLHGVDPVNERLAAKPWFLDRCRRMWGEAFGVVLVGSPLVSYADKLGVPAKRRVIIHNGAAIPVEWHVRQRSIADARVVLSVCNLIELKGVDLNLKALASIQRDRPDLPWRYEIIGDGPQRVALQDLAEMLGIADRVNFLGRLPHEATMEHMANCDVFSLPSWGEAFGMVYLEAMGRGRPVIGCVDCGAAEMTRAGRDGLLVPPKNASALREALQTLIENPGLCSEMGRAGRNRAEEFSWGRNIGRHLELFSAGLRLDRIHRV